MSSLDNAPALQRILRALGTGETLSGKDIRVRSGSEVSVDQRAKLVDLKLVEVERAGRGYRYRATEAGIATARDELGGAIEAPAHGTDRLDGRERTALFALLSPELERTHTDIKNTLGISIAPAVRRSLRDRGLIVLTEKPIRFELTAHGWQTAELELSRPADPGDPALLRLLHHQLRQILGGLRARGLSLVDLYAEDHAGQSVIDIDSDEVSTVGAQVIDAYRELVHEPGGWVSLTRLRDQLGAINRSELDEVLTALFRDDRIKLIAETNQKTLTDRDRAAALHVAGDDKHLYAVG